MARFQWRLRRFSYIPRIRCLSYSDKRPATWLQLPSAGMCETGIPEDSSRFPLNREPVHCWLGREERTIRYEHELFIGA